jgi:hypothetical protein
VPSTSCVAGIPDSNAQASVISSCPGTLINVPGTGLYTKDSGSAFPDFLRPAVFRQNLALFKQCASEAAAIRGFTSLIPLAMARRLISHSFIDFMGVHNLIDESTFMAHLEEQYSEGYYGPAGHPVRWALVNSVIGLATRFKIAPEAEAELSDIPLRLFHNARMVLSDFILLEPTLLSMQALLAMALLAHAVQDEQALVMLTRNASSQLEQFRKANRVSKGKPRAGATEILSEEYVDTTNLEKIIQHLGH